MSPTIDIVNGVKILFYNGEHRPPHFHAVYNEYEAIVAIERGEIIAGKMPAKQLKRVYHWLTNNVKWAYNLFYELNPELL